MKKREKRHLDIGKKTLLWFLSFFFLIGAFTSINKSVISAFASLVLALILAPIIWDRIIHLLPKGFKGWHRALIAFILFFVLISAYPNENTDDTQANVQQSNHADVTSGSADRLNDRKADIVSVYKDGGTYKIDGTGEANKDYTLKFNDDTTVNTITNNDGKFVITIPEGADAFACVELTRDANGFWFGGEEKYDKVCLYLGDEVVYEANRLDPVLIGEGSPADYSVSGYYLAGKTIILKSGDDVLAETKVDDNGYFDFGKVDLKTNFVPISIDERVSTGWFSSKEENILKKRFVNYDTHEILTVLPVYTKEVKVTESISYDTQRVNSSSLAKGKTKTAQAGVEGKKTIIYIVTYRGNEEKDREKKSERVTEQPVTKIIHVGTYVQPQTSSSSGSQSSTPSSSGGVVKMSTSGICHAPGTTYYNRTTNYTAYNSLSSCLSAGGRLPER